MLMAKREHLKLSISELEAVPTAHNSGTKKILTRGFNQPVLIKQVAVGTLSPGDVIEPHIHPDLDEYYMILKGGGMMRVEEKIYKLSPGDFILVTAGSEHELRNDEQETIEFYYQSFQVLPVGS